MRALNERIFEELKSGRLKPFADAVRTDTSLCMELRGDYVNIYYRGGNLIELRQRKDDITAFFDKKYFRHRGTIEVPEAVENLPRVIHNDEDVDRWLEASPVLKKAIDRTLSTRKKDEREFQQRILRDNNFGSIARSTDYYICDIEYQSDFGRFDMIAVRWPSLPAVRKSGWAHGLALIEVKHGDNALEGSAGLHKHIADINKFSSPESKNLDRIKTDMVAVFNQKRALGLLDCGKDLESFNDDKPELILAFVNHDPDKSKLRELLDSCPESPHVDLRIATASFLGYGLFDQGIHGLEDAKKLFEEYI